MICDIGRGSGDDIKKPVSGSAPRLMGEIQIFACDASFLIANKKHTAADVIDLSPCTVQLAFMRYPTNGSLREGILYFSF